VSVINPNDTAASWKTSKRERAIELYVDSIEAASAELVGAKAAGMTVNVNVTPANDWIDYLFVHEFGHHFADLADEYYTSPTSYGPATGPKVEPWIAMAPQCESRQIDRPAKRGS